MESKQSRWSAERASRKDEADRTRETRERYQALEPSLQRATTRELFNWVDSPLEHGGAAGEPIANSFIKLLPEGYGAGFRSYIELILAEKAGSAVGIEFGGPGTNAFGEFSPGFFGKSLGVTLLEHLDRDEQSMKAKEGPTSHAILHSDLVEEATYKKVEEWLDGRKASLIFERMGLGFDLVPADRFLAAQLLSRWYELLDEGGLLFAQVPRALNRPFKEWASMIGRDYSSTIYFKHKIGTTDGYPAAEETVMLLHKSPGAPKDLPLLSAKHALKDLR
jgi:hypothetical protein